MKLEDALNNFIKESGVDTNLISDGYHTFDELYEHRIVLFIALCRQMNSEAMQWANPEFSSWKSLRHSDGSIMEGWFVMGIGTEKGRQITYHLPVKYWDQLNDINTIDKAPEWDGHTSEDVLKRLLEL